MRALGRTIPARHSEAEAQAILVGVLEVRSRPPGQAGWGASEAPQPGVFMRG
jgi:hypothetical protein